MPDLRVPGEQEQHEAWEYVCKRPLTRPGISAVMAVLHIAIFVCVIALCSVVASLLLQDINKFFISGACLLTGLVLVLKKIIIALVHVYQRYAPERIRRKCIFKPTCSEYMILALEKYGLCKGLYKGIVRLFFKCRGFYYSIDYP